MKSETKRPTPKWKSHGEAKLNTPEYRVWRNMRYRCFNEKSRQYPDYGGRGITVCERWSDYTLFLKDMGRRPDLSFTIDRINNDGNYEPGNCRWATQEQQNNNTSRNVKILKGRGYSQVARDAGISDTAIRYRFQKGIELLSAPRKGFRCGKVKANPEIVRDIRSGYIRGKSGYVAEKQKQHSLGESTVRGIISRRTWRHLP